MGGGGGEINNGFTICNPTLYNQNSLDLIVLNAVKRESFWGVATQTTPKNEQYIFFKIYN